MNSGATSRSVQSGRLQTVWCSMRASPGDRERAGFLYMCRWRLTKCRKRYSVSWAAGIGLHGACRVLWVILIDTRSRVRILELEHPVLGLVPSLTFPPFPLSINHKSDSVLVKLPSPCPSWGLYYSRREQITTIYKIYTVISGIDHCYAESRPG